MTTYESMRAALADVVAIPVTPFAEDGSIEHDTHRALLRRLLDHGVRTLTPNGNTGEFYALTPQERGTVVELTVSEAAGRAAIVVGVGHDVPTAIDAARHAREAGADMLMVHQPVHPTSRRAAGSTITAPSPRPSRSWASSRTSVIRAWRAGTWPRWARCART